MFLKHFQTHPYGMLKEASHKLSGNDRFEGFGIDLIHELSLMSGFNYTFEVQVDKSSGNPDKNGKWNGMIGEVLAGVSIKLTTYKNII